MPHRDRADVLRDLKNKAVDVRIRRARFRDLVDHEPAQASEAAQIKFARLVDHEVGDQIREPTSGVTPPGVFLAFVNAEDDVALLRFGNGEQLHNFGRRILQVVIHGNGVAARHGAQSGQDGVVFAEIARQTEERHRQLAFAGELQGDRFGFIAAAIVHDDQLVTARDLERGNFPMERGQSFLGVVERNDDAEMR